MAESEPSPIARYCWHYGHCERAAILVDADAYFRAARQAILAARHSVYILGWDLHSATRLITADDNTGRNREETLWDVLHEAAGTNPGLDIYLLLWDWAVLYANERELIPRVNLDWRLPDSVRLALDSNISIGSSHHQKVLAVDDQLAFAGGLDLTVRRWDRPDHRPGNPDRVDHNGKPYAPYHDIQAMVTGGPAAALGELARTRWYEATGEKLQRPGSTTGTTTGHTGAAAPVLQQVNTGIARTVPSVDASEAVLESKQTLVAMLESARRHVYIENQFICSDIFSETITRCLQNNPQLEVLCITPKSRQGWLESRSMGAERIQMHNRLRQAGVSERIQFYYPVIQADKGKQDIFVHSKLMVVDDRFCRIGSSNLNNRSMGYDTECDLIFESVPEHGQAGQIEAVRNHLLAEHLGSSPATVRDTINTHGLLESVRHLNNSRRGLQPLEEKAEELSGVEDVLTSLADPEEPVSLSDFLSVVSAERKPLQTGRRSRAPLLLVILALFGLALLWRFTGLSEIARPAVVSEFFTGLGASPWTPVIVISLFLIAGFIMFPITILIIAAGVTFGELEGFLYAASGCIASAMVTYWLGYRFGAGKLAALTGYRLQSLEARLRRRGFLAVVTVRIVPVAPFTIINLAAGVARIPPSTYILGTLAGMIPGVAIMTAFGASMMSVITDLGRDTVLQLLTVVLVWALLVWLTRKYIGIIRRGDKG